MGMVTLHLVIGVGIFILPLFLLLFSLVMMSLAHLYIVIGSVSFVASVLTTIILVTKFVNQPAAHGFFSYSDTIASALMSLGLLLDGILYLLPNHETPCYQYKLIYGLFIVPIITGFFSVLGMAIERFQVFALYRDRRKLTRKFSIAWFLASWTLALCFLVILLPQINDKANFEDRKEILHFGSQTKLYISILDLDLFPGPHSAKNEELEQPELSILVGDIVELSQAELDKSTMVDNPDGFNNQVIENLNGSNDYNSTLDIEDNIEVEIKDSFHGDPVSSSIPMSSSTESSGQLANVDVNRPKENLLSEEHRELLLPQILECMRRFRDLSTRLSKGVQWPYPDNSTLRVLKCNEILDPKFSQKFENEKKDVAVSSHKPLNDDFLYDLNQLQNLTKTHNHLIMSKNHLLLQIQPQTEPEDFMKRMDKELSKRSRSNDDVVVILSNDENSTSDSNMLLEWIKNQTLIQPFDISSGFLPNMTLMDLRDYPIHIEETNLDKDLEFTSEKKKNVTSVTVNAKKQHCRITSKEFIMYYLILMFLLCFATPVLITTSLNVFIHSAVQHTTYEVISHHQWLTLTGCILMWGPSLIERLLAKWDIVDPPLVVSVFLFLLGHTHNLLRSVLHAVFAQQIHSITWQGNQLDPNHPTGVRFRWTPNIRNRVKPFLTRSQTERRHSADEATSKVQRNVQAEVEAIETTCI